jgi:hypothetical protein
MRPSRQALSGRPDFTAATAWCITSRPWPTKRRNTAGTSSLPRQRPGCPRSRSGTLTYGFGKKLCWPQSGHALNSGTRPSMSRPLPHPPQLHAFVSVDHLASILGGSSVTSHSESESVPGRPGTRGRRHRRRSVRPRPARDRPSAAEARHHNRRKRCGDRAISLRACAAYCATELNSPISHGDVTGRYREDLRVGINRTSAIGLDSDGSHRERTAPARRLRGEALPVRR